MPKRPKHRARVDVDKRPRWLPASRDGQVSVSFVLFDDVDWCETCQDSSSFVDVAKKIKHYESMRWSDLFNRDHPVQLGKLITPAQKRLIELRLDDVDELWRFRFDSRKRLWGVRFEYCFYALWWDPRHAVCPTKLKHT